MTHQVPHYRTSKKGKRFHAGLGKKKTKTSRSIVRQQPWVYGLPEEASKWNDAKISNAVHPTTQPYSEFGGAKIKSTTAKIEEMLKENTGIAMMDSGGDSNRNWQQNQARNFENEPSFKIELPKNNQFIFMRSTYDFLKENLEVTDASVALQKRFKAFQRKHKDEGGSDLADMEEFAEELHDNYGATGLYGEGKPFTVNTYNHESIIDQVLQYVYFELDGKGYVILQVHGGADVRGGYTDPYVFETTGEVGLMGDNDGYIRFKDGTFMSTDDAGNNWYPDGSTPSAEIAYVEGEPETNPTKIKVNDEIKEVVY
jgi:hypothetical protein